MLFRSKIGIYYSTVKQRGEREWLPFVSREWKQVRGTKAPVGGFFTEQIIKIEIVFSKQEQLRFISHLDLLRLFSRACRRAGLLVVLSRGYSPKLKIKIKRALKLGIESRNEEAEFLIDGSVSPREFRTRLQRQLPQGLKIEKVK